MADSGEANISITTYVYTPGFAFASSWTLILSPKPTVVLTFQKPFPSNTAIPTPVSLEISGPEGLLISWPATDVQDAITVAGGPEVQGLETATPTRQSQGPLASISETSILNSASLSGKTFATSLATDSVQSISNTDSGSLTFEPPIMTTNQTSSAPVIPENPPTQSSTAPDSNRLSAAQVTGIAVGCIAAGILIAALVACLIARKKRQRTATRLSARSRNMASLSDNDLDKKSTATVLKHIERLPSSSDASTLLDRSLSESEVLNLFKRLRERISQLVDGCLRDGGRSVTRRPDASFIRQIDGLIEPQSVVDAQRLAELLLNRQSQADALRFLFAWCIVENIKSTGAPETTLLPPELSECMASMTGLRNDLKGRAILLAKWRQTIRLLMEPTYGRLPNISANDPRQVNIREMASKLLEILKFCNMGNDDDVKLRNLADLICEAATFGYTLFTQPSEWCLDWTNAQYGNESELVVFPALLKVTDEHGHVLPVKELRESIAVVKTG